MARTEPEGRMCTGCGTRLRQGWYRCPRCRTVLGAETIKLPVDAAPPPPSSTPGMSAWRLVGLSLMITMLAAPVAVYLRYGRQSPRRVAQTQPEASAAVVPVATAATSEPEPEPARTVDAEALVARVVADAMRWGQEALAAGDLDQAQAQFEAALAAGPPNADARNGLGTIFIRKGRLPEALAEFDQAIELDASRLIFRVNRAQARALAGEWAGAVDDYRIATARRPQDYAMHRNLGLALFELQRYDAASRALERAVELAPGHSDLLLTLGTAYAAGEQTDRARGVLERFLEVAPDDADAPRARAMLTSLVAPPD